MVWSGAMKRARGAFSLLELIVVVAIMAVLVGAAIPYYQNYVKDAKLAKAKAELDIFREALIKFNTIEDRKYDRADLTSLIGKYLHDLTRDPWGRDYVVVPDLGVVKSFGPDHLDPADDIVVDYLSPLALVSAIWVDVDGNQHVNQNDRVRFDFTRPLATGNVVFRTDLGGDLLVSSECTPLDGLSVPTVSTATYFDLTIPAVLPDTAFFPGSSTIRVASTNVDLKDHAGRFALGTSGELAGMESVFKAR